MAEQEIKHSDHNKVSTPMFDANKSINYQTSDECIPVQTSDKEDISKKKIDSRDADNSFQVENKGREPESHFAKNRASLLDSKDSAELNDQEINDDIIRTTSSTITSVWSSPNRSRDNYAYSNVSQEGPNQPHDYRSPPNMQPAHSPSNRSDLMGGSDSSNVGGSLLNVQRGTFGARPLPRPSPPSASFCRLDVSTDLNMPPPNWLNVDPSRLPPGLAGFNATPHYSGFSSFRMASLFLEYSARERCYIGSGKNRKDRVVGLRGIDVVSDAENIKKLLKMPYSSKSPVSMIVHRIGQSILIDDMDLHRLSGFLSTNPGVESIDENAFSNENGEWRWLKNFFYEIVLTSYESKEKALVRRNTTRNAIQERNLISKFLHRSLEDKTNNLTFSTNKSVLAPSPLSLSSLPQAIANVCEKELTTESSGNTDSYKQSITSASSDDIDSTADTSLQLPPLPEPSSDDLTLPGVPSGIRKGHSASTSTSHESQRAPMDFARTLLWNFEDIRMLIGSDMPIFGDKDHPCVSLRLHNVEKPIHILTGLDYWLDNLMCQVPEVLMCFHLDGIVQKYELVKTEELPSLSEGGTFSPGIIRDVAQNILSFLKAHAAKEGHTYWLFKGKDDDIVKLYDLTSLCDECDIKDSSESELGKAACGFSRTTGKHTSAQEPNESLKDYKRSFKGQNSNPTNEIPSAKNPFRTAVSLLLYKVARNVLQNVDNRAGEEGNVKQLLTNCLQLLDKDKYPQIATSAHFMLSDLYVPDDIDPANPKDKFNVNVSCKPKDGDSNVQQEDKSSLTATPSFDLKTITNTSRRCQKKNAGHRRHSKQLQQKDKSAHDFEDETFRKNHNTDEFTDENDMLFTSPPLTSCVVERCSSALTHAAEGLLSLKNLAKRREEEEEKGKKAREQYERDNPKMCKPNEAIPMPFSSPNDSTITTSNRSRCQSESAVTSLQNPKQSIGRSALSWHDHLKTVLLKKATIIYVVLAETHFVAQHYGRALRCIKRSLNCYEMVCHLTGAPSPASNSTKTKGSNSSFKGSLHSNVSSFISFSFGLAGDSYYKMVQNWSGGVVTYQEEFNAASDVAEQAIIGVIEAHVEEVRREWLIKVPKDIEEAMHLASKCFDMAIMLCGGQGRANNDIELEKTENQDYLTSANILSADDVSSNSLEAHHLTDELSSLLTRRGFLSNERGVFYMNQAEGLAKSEGISFKGQIPEVVIKILNVSTRHLKIGLKDFQDLCDIPNKALIMSNAGRHCRLYAYCYSLVETEDAKVEVDYFLNESLKYKQAIQLYDDALKILTSSEANNAGYGRGKRNQYGKIYESVSWDLQTTCFIYGARLQEATPADAYTMDEVEKMVIDLYNKALRLCDMDTPGPRQPVFQYRAASIHMKLGSLYHLKYRSDEGATQTIRGSKPCKDDHRRKNLKQLAENHYAKAVSVFKELEHGQEFLRAQTERVYLHESDLPADKSGVHGLNNYHKKIYYTIFELLCNSLPVLKAIREAEKLPGPANKNNMIDNNPDKQSNNKATDGSDKDEEDIHIYDVFIKKLQNSLLDLSKLLSTRHQQAKSGGVKTSEFLDVTKKMYLRSIMLKSINPTFLSDLVALLETLSNDFLRYLK